MRTGHMSSRNSSTLTLDVRLRRAESCAAAVVLVGGACGATLIGAASWVSPLAAAAALAVIGFGLWRAGWIGARHRIVGLRWFADGRWVLTGSRDHTASGRLSAGTRRVRNLLWLVWNSSEGRRRSMLLAAGDLPADQFRALSVRLRIEALERALPEALPR